MKHVLRLALLQTILFISVIFFFYVSAYGVSAVLEGRASQTPWPTHVFWLAALLGMVTTVQVLMRTRRRVYPTLAVGSSVVAGAAAVLQGSAPLLAVMPALNAVAIIGFLRQKRLA